MGFLGSWLATAIATAAAIWIVPGIEAIGGSWAAPIFTALVLGILNATVKPIVGALAIPLKVLTLGIFSLVLNAFFLELASYLSRNIFHAGVIVESFGAAFFGAIVISIVGMIVGAVIG
ncbi:phage holin family protein [Paratractidigestivibacter sp.]|uniref:phage holin family protein n=1 Tax=Paratractidigestivibacter sp. TaxID=2847316 RepID=UPI002AC96371|nr:phage holin family protein [Paratractidigestivibacter sp.]